MMAAGGAISGLSMLFIVITLIITLILPFVGWIVLAKKTRGMSGAIIAGVLGFYIPQIVFRIPILQLLNSQTWYAEFIEQSPTLYALALGFSAALFETVGRIVVFYFLRAKLSYTFGFGVGYGHGAIEAIYLVGLTYVNNLIYAFMINVGGVPGLTEALGSEELAVGLIELFADTPSSAFLMAGFERIMTMVIHIALSLIICYGFIVKKLIPCIAIVMTAHTLLDSASVLLSLNGVSMYIIELFILVIALLALAVIVKIKNIFPGNPSAKSGFQEITDDAEKAVEEGY